MGLFSRTKPKIKVQITNKDSFSGWLKCTHCDELIHKKELEKKNSCCPKCDYHYRLTAKKRINLIVDKGSFKELFSDLESRDPLDFIDSEPYPDRLKRAQEKSGSNEGTITGSCTINSQPAALAVMDFNFMGGSMGSVVGERLTLLIEYGLENKMPVIIVSASGGARMQESTLSLMQMAKTSAALAKLSEANIPYISLLTNPTTGGVTASFAALGDVIIAEPGALIAFTGPRVIEQTIGQKLPPEAQKSEFLLKNGMIDRIVNRKDLRSELSEIIEFFSTPEYQMGEELQEGLPNKLKELMTLSLMEEQSK